MPKTFYTERDIEDLFARGGHSLVVGEDVVLTELAYERARQLGVQLLQPSDTPPAAPMRPYLSQAPVPLKPQAGSPATTPRLDELKARVREAVKARLGTQIDPALLDQIIERVASQIGLK
jgi:hypothetical protein